MKILGKYWKILLAVALLLVAAFIYFDSYRSELSNYESESNQLSSLINALKDNIKENKQYANIQDELDDAVAELEASRLELYQKFPTEMKEEDQIMYVLYLETVFGEEIFFSFGDVYDIAQLSDGSSLQALMISVNYKTTYQGFKDMVTYLSTDSRIASVQTATISYDATADEATGSVTILVYLLNTDDVDYVGPDVNIPDTGKDNIFD